MAKVLKEFHFAVRDRYPWTEWFDGRIWQLTRGTDFRCQAQSMLSIAHAKGKKKRLKVLVACRGDQVILQARPLKEEKPS